MQAPYDGIYAVPEVSSIGMAEEEVVKPEKKRSTMPDCRSNGCVDHQTGSGGVPL